MDVIGAWLLVFFEFLLFFFFLNHKTQFCLTAGPAHTRIDSTVVAL